MKTVFSFFVVIVFNSLAWAAAPSKTFFVQIEGDQKIAEKLIQDLTSKECYTLQDIMAVTGMGYNQNECHAFKAFTNQKDIKGDSAFLYKVFLSSKKRFGLQIFKNEGGKLRRIRNTSDFKPKGDFYTELLETTKGLTFK